MSANQHHRLAAETGSEREARLQHNREGQRGQQSQLPLFEQPSVQAKMRKFLHTLAHPLGLGGLCSIFHPLCYSNMLEIIPIMLETMPQICLLCSN